MSAQNHLSNYMAKRTQKKAEMRIEHDAIGSIEVPANAYYGSFTTRALANFNAGTNEAAANEAAAPTFRKAMAMIKWAAAETNADFHLLARDHAKHIITAIKEFIDGRFDDDYQINIFQAGAGTPYNMNLNEIIANRANELVAANTARTSNPAQPTSTRGVYKPINPNNHVNMSQSSNDVIPTAIRIATIWDIDPLRKEIKNFTAALRKKSRAFKKIVKVGRTHLQDAVPITLGQEFESFAVAIEKDCKLLTYAQSLLYEIGLGGTALGTGINTHPRFAQRVTRHLARLTHLPLKPTKNRFETTSNMNVFLAVSSALRAIAVTMQRIAQDLKLLNMGPLGGIGEIILPEVEPGSSIMPGKVNPSIPECVQMIAYQIIGNDHAVSLAAQNGQLELNVMTPLILKNLHESCTLLTRGLAMFTAHAITNITANKQRCQELLERSLCVATALNPHLGYHAVAELVTTALKRKTSLETIIIEKKLMSSNNLKQILNPERLTKPNI